MLCPVQPLRVSPSLAAPWRDLYSGNTPVICERCGKAPATRVFSHIDNGVKRIVYCCEACATPEAAAPALKRPCAQCGQREGRIKLVRLHANRRVVTYICDRCAGSRRR